AALSFLPHVSPEEVLVRLEERMSLLEAEIAAIGQVLVMMEPKIGRLVLVEMEYVRAMRQAERKWVKSLIDDIRNGKLMWDPEQLIAAFANAPQMTPLQSDAMQEIHKSKDL